MSHAGYQAAYRKDVYLYGPRLVDATGARRRLQALARLGWSAYELERLAGAGRGTFGQVLYNRTYVTVAKHAVISGLYERFAMTPCTSPTAGRTARTAARKGWASGMAWDDIDRDSAPVGLAA